MTSNESAGRRSLRRLPVRVTSTLYSPWKQRVLSDCQTRDPSRYTYKRHWNDLSGEFPNVTEAMLGAFRKSKKLYSQFDITRQNWNKHQGTIREILINQKNWASGGKRTSKGRQHDRQLAETYKVSRTQVAKLRESLGIEPAGHTANPKMIELMRKTLLESGDPNMSHESLRSLLKEKCPTTEISYNTVAKWRQMFENGMPNSKFSRRGALSATEIADMQRRHRNGEDTELLAIYFRCQVRTINRHCK